ncbi:DNA repair protein RadC [Arboricoccus pini]|uniref:DNA repair protein RadC n=1 Tax=Arboricoccus pini TaxID=1963835 RepID=A0A212QPC3_9PROT|nr:DNA repair protein RadC [Arboricoccus pini]SNB61280.1 DNA repair protein RadC [Arboricoccus pini]
MNDAVSRENVARKLADVGLSLVERGNQSGGVDHVIVGDTFPHRELIKRLGGRWSSSDKHWRLVEGFAGPGLAEAPLPGPGGGHSWGGKHYHGHRRRLRDRFIETSPASLADYELLELLLFFSVHRRDTKPIAKAMIERFGGLGAALAAEHARYAEIPGLEPPREEDGDEWTKNRTDDLHFTSVLLKAVHETIVRVLKEPIRTATPIASWSALTDYLQASMAHGAAEQFRILFLDRKNGLLRDEVQSRGTVDHTPLYPREVVKRALELSASAIIMVHNHPSGDPTPSKADIEMTRQVIEALETVGVQMHDHVIVGKNRHLSFKAQKLI